MSILDYNLFLRQAMPFEVAEEDTFKGLEDVILDYLNDYGEFDKPKIVISKLSSLRIKLEFSYIEHKLGNVIITRENSYYKDFFAELDNFFNQNKHLINEKDETERNYEQAENESWKEQRNYESLLWSRR